MIEELGVWFNTSPTTYIISYINNITNIQEWYALPGIIDNLDQIYGVLTVVGENVLGLCHSLGLIEYHYWVSYMIWW